MKRGITPIIAVILLIVMTVGIAAFVFIWMQNFVSNLQQTTQQQLETLQRPQFDITYATVKDSSIIFILTNTGTVPIDTTQMTAIVEEYSKVTGLRNRTLTMGNLNCSQSILQARQQTNCTISDLNDLNTTNYYYVLILSYQGVTASYRIS